MQTTETTPSNPQMLVEPTSVSHHGVRAVLAEALTELDRNAKADAESLLCGKSWSVSNRLIGALGYYINREKPPTTLELAEMLRDMARGVK